MGSAGSKPGVRFSITAFEVAREKIPVISQLTRKIQKKSVFRHCPEHRFESSGSSLAGGLTSLVIALNFYKMPHFSFGWLQLRITVVVKLQQRMLSSICRVGQRVKSLSKINSLQSLPYFSFLQHSGRPYSELDWVKQAALCPFVCETEKCLSSVSLKMGTDRAEGG